jgi:hypothetical protein
LENRSEIPEKVLKRGAGKELRVSAGPIVQTINIIKSQGGKELPTYDKTVES